LLHLLNDDGDGVLAKVAVKVAVKDAAAVAVKAAVIIAIIAVPTLAATRLGPASGYEIEFLIRQFDGVSEIGDLLHVRLPSGFDLSVETVAPTAATLSLAARRQSGCTVVQKFFAASQTLVPFSCHASHASQRVIADLRAANLLWSQRN
jgi:hypothetical protein